MYSRPLMPVFLRAFPLKDDSTDAWGVLGRLPLARGCLLQAEDDAPAGESNGCTSSKTQRYAVVGDGGTLCPNVAWQCEVGDSAPRFSIAAMLGDQLLVLLQWHHDRSRASPLGIERCPAPPRCGTADVGCTTDLRREPLRAIRTPSKPLHGRSHCAAPRDVRLDARSESPRKKPVIRPERLRHTI
jgi:hypothetical protein